ncbi:MAG: sulfite exporter TauE/SafE family protein [Chitinophagaceae bacterium]
MFQLIITALIIGFAGSFHCIGMCGAIAISLPIQSLPAQKKKLGILLYNLGRIITYSLIGVLFGLIGRTFYLGGFQKTLSISLGVLILAYLLITYLLNKSVQLKFIHIFSSYVQNKLSKNLMQQGLQNTFIIGLLNGLLPCGMVYFALAGALASGNIASGTIFMAMFGIGTIPLMLLVSHFGIFINAAARNRVKKAMPYFMFAMGILFVLRGLNLNIPFISPGIENSNTRTISCH